MVYNLGREQGGRFKKRVESKERECVYVRKLDVDS